MTPTAKQGILTEIKREIDHMERAELQRRFNNFETLPNGTIRYRAISRQKEGE
jgi:hypothetical protein